MIESITSGGIPPAPRHPGSNESAASRSSFSRVSRSTHPEHGITMTASDAQRAAWCELRHGDPRQSDEERHALKGMSDLIGRTWKAGRDTLTRDDRRLMQKYRATLDAADEERLAAYRRCVECNPGSTTDEGHES